ncbi:MAG: diguanylate cyclase (GGDEF)-like protein/PAS domain S-box-containing protein [Planctomycetota bacterium]|jgi:diguanylate cyclase (GGDEF)-like protein/PAS domain S-box-containing protein
MVETVVFVLLAALAGAAFTYWWQRKSTPSGQLAGQASNHPTQSKDQLHGLIEATVGTTGETYFYALVRELSKYLGTDAVFLAVCEDPSEQSFRTLAYWCDGGYMMNQSVSLEHSPGGEGGNFWYMENSAGDLFPQSTVLNDRFKASGFFMIKLQNSSGLVIGVLASLHRQALQPHKNEIDVIKLFAARAAAELERKLAIGETLMEKERAQITLHSIGDGVVTTDHDGRIDYMNPVAESMTGWRYHQAMGMSMEAVVHLEDEQTGAVIPDPVARCLNEKRVIAPKTDNVLISRNGERYSIQGTAAPMINAQGNSIGVVLVFKDVSDSRRIQKMMVHQATHDPLTGLVNRSEFEDRLEKALSSAREFENTHALLYLDLDQFKVVNDSAGHVAGDELLKQISALLANQLRGRDTLGRLGGDEFSVLLSNCPVNKAKKLADILIEVVREYRFIWDQKSYQVGVSIGIVPITAESGTLARVMDDADQACYVAKDLGRGRSFTHCSERGANNRPTEKLQHADLRDALAEERFVLLYQPIVSLDNENTILHTRAEVLLRMLDKKDNLLAPGSFLSAAIRFGLMPQIDRWVIERVFNRYSHIFMQNPDLVLGLNLSAPTIAEDSLLDFILQCFAKSVVQPHQICFELSENALNNNLAAAGRLINELRAIGCTFALDDFGSGLASFQGLKNLKLDFVKIDGSLIRDIGSDPLNRSMVESINSMAQLLELKTVAKSVEDESTMIELKNIGIDYAQGYHLGGLSALEEIGVHHHRLDIAEIEIN